MKKPGKIAEIFLYYWDEYVEKNHIRDTEAVNVKRMLICRTPFLGKHLYECPVCRYSLEVPHSCKSRFCSVCGYKATEDWIALRFNTLLDCPYHHVVVTVPRLFRWMIKLDRVLTLNMFARLATETIMEWCAERGYEPGIICFHHSFGSWLQFHPHFHLLVSMGGITPAGTWKYSYGELPGQVLMDRFRAKFIAGMKTLFEEGKLKTTTKLSRVMYQINQTYDHHWQFYSERITKSWKQTIFYMVRYAKKMIISELRIIDINHRNRTVTFFDSKKVTVYVYDVLKFIHDVVQHIPEKHFRLIRYYGFYANASKKYEIARKYWQPLQKTKQKLRWYQRQWMKNGFHPMYCPLCNCKLVLKAANYPKPLYRISINDIMKIYFSNLQKNMQLELKMEYG